MESRSRRKLIDFHNLNSHAPADKFVKNPNMITPIHQISHPRFSGGDHCHTERRSLIENSPLSLAVMLSPGIDPFPISKSVANSRESSPSEKTNTSSRLVNIKQYAKRSLSGKSLGMEITKAKTIDPSKRKRLIIKSKRTPQSSTTQDLKLLSKSSSSSQVSTPNTSIDMNKSQITRNSIFNSHAFKIQPHLINQESCKEDIDTTSDIQKYNEIKFKLVTNDPLLIGINDGIRRWKAGENLGHGSYGQVIKAFDVDSGQIFAVKRLFFNPENPSQAEFVGSLNREINVLKNLSHKNIVKYLGSEVIKDNFCIYLEYLPGGSIAKLLYNLGPLPEVTVKIYTKHILKGLVYLHSNGVVHRDIKGANLLLDSDGKIRLSDFGCSKKYESTEHESGLLKSVKGSLPWMAPEVVKQTGHGRKADIWSLGCVVLEMLTAKSPWPNMDNYILTMMKIARSDEIPEIPEILTENAKDFIVSCLQRDPKKRKTAEELLKHQFIMS